MQQSNIKFEIGEEVGIVKGIEIGDIILLEDTDKYSGWFGKSKPAIVTGQTFGNERTIYFIECPRKIDTTRDKLKIGNVLDPNERFKIVGVCDLEIKATNIRRF